MHEFALTQRLVAIVLEAAQAQGGGRVLTVKLVLGGNTGILPDSLPFYFEVIAQGTSAQGATLEIRQIPPEMHCAHCAENFQRPLFSFACPKCGALGQPTDIGNEFYVESIEMDDSPPQARTEVQT